MIPQLAWFNKMLAGLAVLAAIGPGAMLLTSSPGYAQNKKAYYNYQPIGWYFNRTGAKKLWVATIGLTPKALDRTFYEDPGCGVIMRAGDFKGDINGQDIIVHLMKDFNYKGAEKFKFMKY